MKRLPENCFDVVKVVRLDSLDPSKRGRKRGNVLVEEKMLVPHAGGRQKLFDGPVTPIVGDDKESRAARVAAWAEYYASQVGAMEDDEE